MSAIINNSFRKFQADNFIDSFTETNPDGSLRKNIYVAIGKNTEWSGNTNDNFSEFRVTDSINSTASDTNIPLPIDTVQAPFIHWDDIASIKKVTDVSHVIARYDWTSGTVYREYSHDRDDIIDNTNPAQVTQPIVAEAPFYVFTEDFRVYKCISNNNGAESIEKPTGASIGLTKTVADGYIWKFMYEVEQADVLKYLTSDWIPANSPAKANQVEQIAVEAAKLDGSIDHIKVIQGGSGYRSTVGNPVGGITAGTLPLQNAAAGSTTQVAEPVDDFYNGLSIYITSGPGQGQFRTITDYDGDTRTALITPDWDTNDLPTTNSVYIVAPIVAIDGTGGTQFPGGSGITARVSKLGVGGVVEQVSIVDRTPTPNTAYRRATATVVDGSGMGSELKVIINPFGGHGSDCVSELGGAFVMMNVRLRGRDGDGDFETGENAEFRKVHILVNPKESGGDMEIATGPTYRASELQQDTGTMLYSEFRPPIFRSTDSTEDIKLVVEF